METSNETVSVDGIEVSPPDTAPKNWELQAHSVWRAAVYLARHIEGILSPYICGVFSSDSPAYGHVSALRLDALELGAASGLPGISLAIMLGRNLQKRSDGGKIHAVTVTLSDYPDPSILSTLRSNIERNSLLINPEVTMKVIGHIWGSTSASAQEISDGHLGRYDLIIAADVLWLRDQHANLLTTFKNHLRLTDPDLKINPTIIVVAGLHTGRHVIAHFLKLAGCSGFHLKRGAREVRLVNDEEDVMDPSDFIWRDWAVERADETAADRSLWVVEIILGRS